LANYITIDKSINTFGLIYHNFWIIVYNILGGNYMQWSDEELDIILSNKNISDGDWEKIENDRERFKFWEGRVDFNVSNCNPCEPDKTYKKIERLESGIMPSRSFGDSGHLRIIAEPQTYIWDRVSETILCVCSDSFVENYSTCNNDHRSCRVRKHPHPVSNPESSLTRPAIVDELLKSIKSSQDLQTASTNAVSSRVKFATFDTDRQGRCIRYGDDTTLILMAL
jgi:hypothetical protein